MKKSKVIYQTGYAVVKSYYKPTCFDCGHKQYKKQNGYTTTGITISIGKCLECGKKAGIVPAKDWQDYEGKSNSFTWD